jgi:hypothetical protein
MRRDEPGILVIMYVSKIACVRGQFLLCSAMSEQREKGEDRHGSGRWGAINPCGFDRTVFARDPARHDLAPDPIEAGWVVSSCERQ